MKILPFEKYEIVSEKTREELSALIGQCCEPREFSSGFNNPNKPLRGRCQSNEFKLYRTISHRNSFLPIAVGKIEADGAGLVITISLRMNIAAMLFAAVWMSFALLLAIGFIFSGKVAASILPFGMVAFGYLLVQKGFWSEVPKLKRLIGQAVADHS